MYERFPARAGIAEWSSFAAGAVWWGLDAISQTQAQWTLVLPSALMLYEVWKLWGAYYELQEISLFRHAGFLAETIPYANITAYRKKQETSRLPILKRDYLELEYRTSKGKVLTVKLSPALMDDFVTQLGDRMRISACRAVL